MISSGRHACGNELERGTATVAGQVSLDCGRLLALRRLSVCFVIIGLVGTSSADADTIAAASCSSAHVQAAIDAAVDGDVVVVPHGSCSWTTGVSISGKGIHLKAQTRLEVTITNNVDGAESSLIAITEDTTHRVRVSDLRFVGGTGPGRTIRVGYTSGGKAVLIDNNVWSGRINAIRMETNRGVIWRNSMTSAGHTTATGADVSFVQCKPEQGVELGLSWTTPDTMGTRDTTGESNIYVEDNTLTRVIYQAFDPDGNCRIVIRYNTFDNSALSSHGPDTGPIGLRHFELYNNTFTFTNFGDCDGSKTAALAYTVFLRGGTGVITDNVFPLLQSCAWGTKHNLIFTVMMPWRNAGPYSCWRGGYPVPRQIGQGHNGIATVLDPVYVWNNTGDGSQTPIRAKYEPNECGTSGTAQTIESYLSSGRDYVGAARPGYTKYPYPHPLRGDTTTPPGAPLNVRITG